jgi:asparagine synthase (glutamine-hydrolysing)
MTAFAAVVDWTGGVESGRRAADLLLPLDFRAFDTRGTQTAPGADMAVAVRAVVGADTAANSIFLDKNRQWLVVGDVRLYEPGVLRSRLGADPSSSNVELVARMYAEFGDAGLATINGDFSVVIWNWGERTAHAIRDHLGLRPLFFRARPDGMAFASDVRQLLASDEQLEPDMILDYLTGDLIHHGLTFFRSIRQVWPGHRLRAGRSGVTQLRYWQPSNETRSQLTYPDMIAEWRHFFERAVACRLVSDYPMGSYLSGGLDSGSIVGVAHRIYEDQHSGRPRMFTLSALFPGLSCDETELIEDAVKARPGFASLTWNGSEVNGADLSAPHPVMPGLRRGMAYGPCGDLELIERHQIRSVLSGFAGDELGWSHGYFRDLLSRGQFAALIRELGQMNSWQRALQHLRIGIRGFGASYLPRGVPEWAGTSLVERFESRTDARRDGHFIFESASQQESWWLATFPGISLATDSSRLVLNDSGAELRLPYRDLRLIEFVLTIPWALRAPRGDLRRVQREAVSVFLSPLAREHKTKVLAGGAVSHQLRSNFGKMREIIDGPRWTLSGLVDQGGARRALRKLGKLDPRIENPRPWIPLWKIAVLETWNRARLNYHVTRRLMMHDAKGDHTPEPAPVGSSGASPSYEAPTLKLVGNVKNLLAASSGPSFDPGAPEDGQAPG